MSKKDFLTIYFILIIFLYNTNILFANMYNITLWLYSLYKKLRKANLYLY